MEYSEELLYKLWLNIICDHDPRLIERCLARYDSAEEVYNAGASYKDLISGFKMARILKAPRSLSLAIELFEDCMENGITIIPFGDERYPKRLAEIYAPPQILYVKGELPDIDNLVCVTIVGARDCSDYGRTFANELAYDLTNSGIVVISGMANGIDSSAHMGALNAGGVTVAALAGGVDVVYPRGNSVLYGHIIKNGAVISERPPGTIGRGSFYKERNRILVGLSNGVVIVEGRIKSGTNLTANWASNEDRDLFAVPGRPDDVSSELPNNLIKENAKLITSAEDIVMEYQSVYPKELKRGIKLVDKDRNLSGGNVASRKGERLPKPDFKNFEGNQRTVLEYLYNQGEEVHIDQIARECGISASEMGGLIIQLLMVRAVMEHPGEYYSLNRN